MSKKAIDFRKLPGVPAAIRWHWETVFQATPPTGCSKRRIKRWLQFLTELRDSQRTIRQAWLQAPISPELLTPVEFEAITFAQYGEFAEYQVDNQRTIGGGSLWMVNVLPDAVFMGESRHGQGLMLTQPFLEDNEQMPEFWGTRPACYVHRALYRGRPVNSELLLAAEHANRGIWALSQVLGYKRGRGGLHYKHEGV